MTPTRVKANSILNGISPHMNNTSNNMGRNNPNFSIDDDLDDEADVGASRSEVDLGKYKISDVKKN